MSHVRCGEISSSMQASSKFVLASCLLLGLFACLLACYFRTSEDALCFARLGCFMLACLTCLLLRGSCLHPPRCVSKGPVVVRLAEWHFNVNVNVKLRTASRRVKFVSKQLENVKRARVGVL